MKVSFTSWLSYSLGDEASTISKGHCYKAQMGDIPFRCQQRRQEASSSS